MRVVEIISISMQLCVCLGNILLVLWCNRGFEVRNNHYLSYWQNFISTKIKQNSIQKIRLGRAKNLLSNTTNKLLTFRV